MIPLAIAVIYFRSARCAWSAPELLHSCMWFIGVIGLGMTITASGHQVFIGTSWETDTTPGYWFVVINMLVLFFLFLPTFFLYK